MTERLFIEKLIRRLISVPMIFISMIVVVALAPVLIPGCFIADLFRRKKWATMRSVLFLYTYLLVDSLALMTYFIGFLVTFKWLGLNKKPFEKFVYWLQRNWGRMLFAGFLKLFNIKLDIDEPEGLNKGPLMLFLRHASFPDVSLAGILFIVRHRMKIRHVIKRELLWEPCLDLGGSAIPTFFVRRETYDNEKELAGIKRLAEDVQEERDGIMIFPEGTRFTPKKRERVLQKIAERGDKYMLEKARALKNLLPPRLGGSLAILDGNRIKAYAVFVTHHGFETANKAINFLNGKLVDQTIRIKLWKVPFENIPVTREERIEWLFHWWMKMDRWIEQQRQAAQKGVSKRAAA